MSIYDIDYSQSVTNLLPVNHRKTRFQSWLDVLLFPLQQDHDNFFTEYMLGYFGAKWNGLLAYNRGDKVRFLNAVYQAQQDIASGINPIPTQDTVTWYKICDDWRGAYERIKYNSRKIELEFILNKFFETTFRQPVTVSNPQPSRPDIYIDNNNPDNNVFTVYDNDLQSSRSFFLDAYSQQFILDSYSFTGNHFTIYVPETGTSPRPGWYSSINPQNKAKVRAIADKYVIAGMTYNVVPY